MKTLIALTLQLLFMLLLCAGMAGAKISSGCPEVGWGRGCPTGPLVVYGGQQAQAQQCTDMRNPWCWEHEWPQLKERAPIGKMAIVRTPDDDEPPSAGYGRFITDDSPHVVTEKEWQELMQRIDFLEDVACKAAGECAKAKP